MKNEFIELPINLTTFVAKSNTMNKIRLNKFISDSGYCSRRQADEYISQGRVTVNMRDCDEPGTLVWPTDKVEVDGEPVKRNVKRLYMAFNKPVGVTCTTDRADKTNIIDFIGHKERIFPVGRLDKLSQGLIFLTNDGDIVNKILRAGNAHEKHYLVDVNKPISDDFIRRMAAGVRLDATTRTLPCDVTRKSETKFEIVLTQGLNRQIRRMCEVLHYEVKKLQRVKVLNISLRGIEIGKWRYFTADEVERMNAILENSDGTQSDMPERRSAIYRKPAAERAPSAERKPAADRKPTKKAAGSDNRADDAPSGVTSAPKSRGKGKKPITAFNSYRRTGRAKAKSR